MLKYKTKFGGRHFPPGNYNNVKICKSETDSKGNLIVTLDYTNAKPVDPAWAESYGDLSAKRHPAANRSSDLYELNKATYDLENNLMRKGSMRPADYVFPPLPSTWMEIMEALGATNYPVSNGTKSLQRINSGAITTAKIATSATSGFDPALKDYTHIKGRHFGPVQSSPGLWSRVWSAINHFAFRDS